MRLKMRNRHFYPSLFWIFIWIIQN